MLAKRTCLHHAWVPIGQAGKDDAVSFVLPYLAEEECILDA